MDIPVTLKDQITAGNVILMLGAGASLAATDSSGKNPPKTQELAALIARKFLAEDYVDSPLNVVSALAINETTLADVQDYIRDILLPFQPSRAHLAIPTFRWRAIVTTNYDELIESSYQRTAKGVQKLVPIRRNTDRYDDAIRDADSVPLLKLHGCITVTHDEKCPLILTTDQYNDFMTGRDQLFHLFSTFGAQRPILMIGFSNQDPDIRAIFDELQRQNSFRPRYYLVTPSVDDFHTRFWEKKHITALKGTFEEAIDVIDKATASPFRGLRTSAPAGSLSIAERFVIKDAEMTQASRKAMEIDFEYVKSVQADIAEPKKFYSGVSHSWGAIEQDLDVRRRRLEDSILFDFFLSDASDFEFLLIKGYAGSGKSVFLRRLAWEAARVHDKLCLFATDDATLSSAVISELLSLTKERIFLFIDNVLAQRGEIEGLVRNLGSNAKQLTIIGGARSNEWNNAPPQLQTIVTETFPLPYLTPKEVDQLIDLLESHKAVIKLAAMSKDQRRATLREQAGQELLVALHEATSGRRFEEILHDEYSNLSPNKAKSIYLSICMLNQYNVAVRAGIIARRFGITFEQFHEHFFKPLEDVVMAHDRKGNDDYCYTARHPHIAEIVVKNELSNPEDLLAEYVACLAELNEGFSSDKRAFQQMVQGRRLLQTFNDPKIIDRVFSKAEEIVGPKDGHLLQQIAIYEMNRTDGDLAKAEQCLGLAMEQMQRNRQIKHTLAELQLRKASAAPTDLERKRLWTSAETICRQLIRDADDSYPFYTLVKTGIERLRDLASDDEKLQNEDVEALIKSTERELEDGLQRFPSNPQLLALAAELAKLVSGEKRFEAALKKAFEANPRNSYAAVQLTTIFEQKNDLGEATKIFEAALAANRSNSRLHHTYGKFLLRHKLGDDGTLLFHFARAYQVGDNNYEAQILHGRQLFCTGDFEGSNTLFRQLSKAKVPYHIKRETEFALDATFVGTVTSVEAYYIWIRRDGDGASVRLDSEDSTPDVWRKFSKEMKVTMRIGFSMFGPKAFDVQIT